MTSAEHPNLRGTLLPKLEEIAARAAVAAASMPPEGLGDEPPQQVADDTVRTRGAESPAAARGYESERGVYFRRLQEVGRYSSLSAKFRPTYMGAPKEGVRSDRDRPLYDDYSYYGSPDEFGSFPKLTGEVLEVARRVKHIVGMGTLPDTIRSMLPKGSGDTSFNMLARVVYEDGKAALVYRATPVLPDAAGAPSPATYVIVVSPDTAEEFLELALHDPSHASELLDSSPFAEVFREGEQRLRPAKWLAIVDVPPEDYPTLADRDTDYFSPEQAEKLIKVVPYDAPVYATPRS